MDVQEIDREISQSVQQIRYLELKIKNLKKKRAILTKQECFLEEITSDLILNFCAFLDPRDITRLGATQKNLHKIIRHDYLWNLLLKDRFRVNAENGQALEKYKDSYRKTKRLDGVDLRVTWMDDNHWRKIGKSIELLFVWWFEVRGTFLGVKSGIYQPILSGKFSRGENIQHIRLSIRSKVDGESTVSEFLFSDLERTSDHIVLPTITVGDKRGSPFFHDLEVDMLDLESGLLKQGIAIDYLELKEIKDF